MNNFDIFRYKDAGMTNLGVNRWLKFYRKHNKKLGLRQLAQVAQIRSISDFIARYKAQDVLALKAEFQQFQSFSILDAVYPEHLREIYNPPTLIFYQGNLELLKQPKIAFVGAREATAFGKSAVSKLVNELPDHFTIVSGLARGIDTASHIAAIKAGRTTIAVVGTGLALTYPRENHALQDYIAENQLILSEYAPNDQALKFHFPERNRIIAGLSLGVVVIEAKLRSGSLITAERALEEGRDVFAVPGNIADGYSDGCNSLIQQGAKLVFRGQDIVEEYQVFL
jgi:DNA processing protein